MGNNRMSTPKTFKVWVAREEDGEPLLWTTAFRRQTCQAYLDDALSEVVDREIVRATLTLAPPSGKKRTR